MKVAIQLGRLNAKIRKEGPGALQRIADAGFRYVETDGVVEGSDASGRKELDEAGLRSVAVTFNLHDFHSRFDGAVATAKEQGAEYVVIEHLRLDDFGDGWRLMGERIRRWVDAFGAEGFKTAYHNHRMEFAPDEGRTGLESLLEGAGPDLFVEFDVAWARKGGQDPVPWFTKLDGRIALVHLDSTCLADNDLCEALVRAGHDGKIAYAVVVPDPRSADPVPEAEVQFRNLIRLGADDGPLLAPRGNS
ncbi:MAG: TIM barrel protein [Armatimonadetes bacterium]|nr:TIM barrel protein [Armatimonadota bacterium]